MVATQSIESAINYFALKKITGRKRILSALRLLFQDRKKGIEYTEDSINNSSGSPDTAKPTDPGYISDKIARYFDGMNTAYWWLPINTLQDLISQS